ncbi:MAG: TonB-dependent receptor [Rhodanobacter sp.]
MKLRNTSHRIELRRSALVIGLGMALSLVGGTAFAQSRAAGAIFGSANAGSQITLVSKDTGLTRTLIADGKGRYRANELPFGSYTVSASSDGKPVGSPHEVMVGAGGTEVDFTVADLSTITVSATSLPAIDVSRVDTNTNLTATILNNVPVARDITQAAVLAPSVIPSDSRYGNSLSIGGSAASENAYFINGYPVTNSLTNIGSTTLPFDAIQAEQVITGGYSARYGRSTGGVISINTKSGSNEWKAGVMAVYSPDSLRSTRKSSYYEMGTGSSKAGTIYQDRSQYESNPFTYGAYISGPLIKDRLFIYANAEWTQNHDKYNGSVLAPAVTGSSTDYNKSPRWLTKINWNINDSNLLEVTAISDKTGNNNTRYSYDYPTHTRGTTQTGGYRYKDGGETYIGKYTGYLTDNLTLSATYGEQKVIHYSAPVGYDPTKVFISDGRPGGSQRGLQPYSSLPDSKAYDTTDGYRLDLEWHLGDHDLSFGYDVSNAESRAGTGPSGPGYTWTYQHTAAGDIPSSGGLTTAPNSDYVIKTIFANGGTFKVEQKAFYAEDRWQVSDRWLVSLGLRNDSFKNFNSDGIAYVTQKNQWAPRIGATWDVMGDSTLKVYANAGRYFLAMPANVALRGAAGSTYTTQFYKFSSIDPTSGVPQGTVAIGSGAPYSSNNEYGQAPAPQTVAAKGLKSHYQDEYILGMQQALGSSWNWGARLQYRDLKSAIDDQCDNRPMLDYMAAHNIAVDPSYSYSPDCRLFNPGVDNTMLLDLPDGTDGNFVAVPYTKKAMGMYLKRRYVGLDLSLEHPFDGKWFAHLDYTLSHNYGNDEGQLNSDIGQGDVSQTTLFDHKELMAYGGGNLPNDRRHVLKAYGFYQLTPEWQFGGAVVARTGRPKNCLGYVPPTSSTYSTFWDNYLNYGRYYHFCGGKPVPRGTAGRLPSDIQVSLNVAYTPGWADGKLKLQADVFNVFNRQVAQNVEERGERGGQNVVDQNRFRVLSYDAPRSVRVSVRYDF